MSLRNSTILLLVSLIALVEGNVFLISRVYSQNISPRNAYAFVKCEIVDLIVDEVGVLKRRMLHEGQYLYNLVLNINISLFSKHYI